MRFSLVLYIPLVRDVFIALFFVGRFFSDLPVPRSARGLYHGEEKSYPLSILKQSSMEGGNSGRYALSFAKYK
jgi:hypothetical protein